VKLSPTTPVLVGQKYYVTASGFRNLVGNAHDSRRLLDVPKPVPKKPSADSTKRAAADSTRRPPPGGKR
jgi:hypothetical protein